MEDKKEPPDADYGWGDYEDSWEDEWNKDVRGVEDVQETKGQRAKTIYNELIDDDELMNELNILLRQKKIDNLTKKK